MFCLQLYVKLVLLHYTEIEMNLDMIKGIILIISRAARNANDF